MLITDFPECFIEYIVKYMIKLGGQYCFFDVFHMLRSVSDTLK